MPMAPAIAKVEDKNPGAGNAKSMGIFMFYVGIKRRVWVFVGGGISITKLCAKITKSFFEQQLQENQSGLFARSCMSMFA